MCVCVCVCVLLHEFKQMNQRTEKDGTQQLI